MSNLIPIKYDGKIIRRVRIGDRPYNSFTRRRYYRRSQMNFFQRWFDTCKEIIKHWLQYTVKPFLIKWIVRPALIGTFFWLAGQVAMYKYSEYVKPTVFESQAAQEIKEVVNVEKYVGGVPPVMKRIAGCESEGNRNKTGRQFDNDGNVVKGWVDKNDIGKYQINETHHGVEAKKLGYDIYTEKGNEAMAMYLYSRQGTEPWYPSKKCWR